MSISIGGGGFGMMGPRRLIESFGEQPEERVFNIAILVRAVLTLIAPDLLEDGAGA